MILNLFVFISFNELYNSMNIPVITTYSVYWLLLIIMLAAGLTWFIYLRNKVLSELSKVQKGTLGVLRFFSLLLIGFLLLGPMVKLLNYQTKKPVIIFAQDNSRSMVLSNDSLFVRQKLKGEIERTLQKLQENYDIKTIQFGDSISSITHSFTDVESNFEMLFNEFNSTYYNENIGGLIICSDGISNRGLNPVYAASNLSFPIYTIPVGDTLLKPDLLIHKIEYNKVVYQGANFPVKVGVSANMLQGTEAIIEIWDKDRVVKSEKVTIDNNTFYRKLPFYLKADSAGVFEYSVVVKTNTPELNLKNNNRKIFVEIEKNRRKILLFQNAYHPDVAVFQRVLKTNPAFQLQVMNPADFKGNLLEYSLVILYQLPSTRFGLQNIIPQVIKHEIPLLFIVGEQSNLNALNNLGSPLKIDQKNSLFQEVLADVNPDFTLFNFEVDERLIADFPPLTTAYADISLIPHNKVLIYQQLGAIKTDKPLWAFSEWGNQKVGFVLGEGFWKWRIKEYKNNRDHAFTNDLLIKTIQYLALKDRKMPFEIEYQKIISENKEIVINARLLNELNELVKNAEINININDEIGNSYPFTFMEQETNYSINIGSLKAGRYNFKASTVVANKILTKTGIFIVKEDLIEETNLLADHSTLYKLSDMSKGKLIEKEEIDQLYGIITENPTIKPIIYTDKSLKDIIQFRWLFLILLTFLAGEWFLRKFWGLI